ncbi:hypothetical protein BDB01DRAFT_906163 [Pilobolus umbonatus]|nr:hypothetical protein BDB01DRAFT_906163 [Pilobolus umbonatus]
MKSIQQNIISTVLTHLWRLFQYATHISLSHSEQTQFEEQFKYLIVTSSLINNMDSPQSCVDTNHGHDYNCTDVGQLKNKVITRLVIMTVMNIFIVSLTGIKLTKALHTHLCLLVVYGVSCYMLYQYYRRQQIRITHATALMSIQTTVSLSQQTENMINSMNEQSNMSPILHHIETYNDLIQSLQPYTDTNNLHTLNDMYNMVDTVSSELSESTSGQCNMDDINAVVSLVRRKRKEYMIHLLALTAMSNIYSTRYEKNWEDVIGINGRLVRHYYELNRHLLDSGKGNKDNESGNTSNESTTDKLSSQFIHRMSAVDKYMEDIMHQWALCKQDTNTLNNGQVKFSTLRKLEKRFLFIDQNMQELLVQWKGSMSSLDHLLADENKLVIATHNILPSPPSSPRSNQSNFHGIQDTNSLQFKPRMEKARARNVQSNYSDTPLSPD